MSKFEANTQEIEPMELEP